MDFAHDDTCEEFLPPDLMEQLDQLPPLSRSLLSSPLSAFDPDEMRLAEGFSEWWDEED